MRKTFTYLSLALLLSVTAGLSAQNAGRQAISYLQKNFADLGLEASDVAHLEVTDDYPSPNGTRHVYVAQKLHGLPVFNTQAGLHFRGDRLIHRTSDLATGLGLVPSPAPAFSAREAVSKAVKAAVGISGAPVAIGTEDGKSLFSWAAVSPRNLTATQGYYVDDAGIHLAYVVDIDQHATRSDFWSVTLDAVTGTVLDKQNLVLTCSFGAPGAAHSHGADCTDEQSNFDAPPLSEQMMETVMPEESRYHVVPFGEESPLHGGRVMEVSPAHPVASPFGWHDVNGVDGAEHTITRGNNVYAYRDIDGDDSPDAGITAEGGDSLVFDFFFADDTTHTVLVESGMVQTFYMVNKLHDWLTVAGFDEAAGNFQRRNYSDDGRGGDEVNVETQDNFEPADATQTPSINNANFFTPRDGTSGAMQMFLWTRANNLQIAEGSAAGNYTTGTALFGPTIGDEPIEAELAVAKDGSFLPDLVCEEVVNDDEIKGKFALINRGECLFEQKVFNAQVAGAAGVIICNPANTILNMAEATPSNLFDVTIPSILIPENDCVTLRSAIINEGTVAATFRRVVPPARDAAFDNGIVAHELGHGVSNRLIGGPNNTGCLGNDEQMGEGWSDFITLATSPQTIVDNPDGTELRGIGNYATRGLINGGGIRNLPYSTDFDVNNHTYDDVIYSGTAPHPLGEVWNTVLWDLYWAMVDEYGFDADLTDGDGGNHQAVKLVLEGMKFTACRPGLTDGRDGILAADEDLFDGANQCMIWEVFARRGLGFSAEQGSTTDRTDNREAFDVSPYCPGKIELTKNSDKDLIDAGEEVDITLRAESFREGVSSKVVITDVIPAGMTLDESSVRGSDDFRVDGDVVTFNLGDMDFEDTRTIVYTVTTDEDLGSSRSFFDGVEDGDDLYELFSIPIPFSDPEIVDTLWEITETQPYEGDAAWFMFNTGTEQEQVLQTFEPLPVTGARPALRFFTRYQIESAYDGGVVEVSLDGTTWDLVADKMIRGGYRDLIDPDGRTSLAGIDAFWGNSGGYREIVVDLSEYAGEEVFIRWRFVSDAATSDRGWWVDNIEMIDVFNYESTARLVSDAGDDISAEIGNLGVLAIGEDVTNTNDPTLGQTVVNVYPNPAGNFVTVDINSEKAGAATVRLMSIDGRALRDVSLNLVSGGGRTTFNTADLPAGIYLVQVTGAQQVSTTKVTIR